jgi:hypothetical protein
MIGQKFGSGLTNCTSDTGSTRRSGASTSPTENSRPRMNSSTNTGGPYSSSR